MLKPGDEIDIWVVDRALGQGGMGSVYRCHNREARRILAAVKVLDSALGRQERAKARFVREAEILFSLDHPNIVKVRNVRMDVALPYLEMEYIDGINLETRARDGALNVGEALPIFRQIAEAVAHLHERGIRHRDIKPSNLVIQANGNVKLVDFGIATEADSATITHHGQTFGSVSYAPPEWLDPAELDPARWDIYALGLVFWEALTGVQAFPMSANGSVQQQMMRLMTIKQGHPPLDPKGDVPEALRALIRDMTRADWRERIQSADVVRARLAAIDPDTLDPKARGEAPEREESSAPRAPSGDTMVPMGFDAPPAFQLARNATISGVDDLDEPAHVDSLPVVAGTLPRVESLPVVTPRPPATKPVSPPVGAHTTVDPAPSTKPGMSSVAMLGAGIAFAGLVAIAGTLAWQAGQPVEAVAIATPPTDVVVPPTPTPDPGPPPEPPPTEVAVAAVEPVPDKPAEKPRARGPGSIVTASAFSRWLGTHPEWAPDAARAAGKADAAYLSGWDGTTPPAGKNSGAVVNVPWAAASAYCAGRGGLPGVDDGALTWTESATQPWHEYRSADGRPAWRRSDGATSTAVNRAESGAFIGFRCAK